MNQEYIKIFSLYLNQLSQFLFKIESCVNGNNSILEARLADDMFPLYTQAEIAANFSLRACCPLAHKAVVSFAQQDRTFIGIQTQLKQTLSFLGSLGEESGDLPTEPILDFAGPVQVSLPACEFLQHFALPNFFFHISMVYAIARSKGIAATKGDFDGFHQYPKGFSFEKPNKI
jgi:hypothetical protein